MSCFISANECVNRPAKRGGRHGVESYRYGVCRIGLFDPGSGAITQEIIDVVAVLNALRAAIPPKTLSDF
jgi:hypothetical protein